VNVGKKKETTEEKNKKAREKKLAKEREKRKKKMTSTKYGQTPLRHARKGFTSCILAVVSAFFIVLMIGTSYTVRGEVGAFLGVLGLATLVIAVIGLIEGIQGFQERDRNYVTCRVGIGVNIVLILFMCAIFIRGLF